MIRRADKNDTDAVAALWKRNFPGDGEEYVRFFLSRCFSDDECLLDCRGGRPVSMLHLLPMSYRDGGLSLPGQCVYAACTLPEYRGRGLMSGLLRAARPAGPGCAFTALYPASESLYRYYGQNGYRALSAVSEAAATRPEAEREAAGTPPLPEESPDPEKLARLRAAAFFPAVLWEGRLSRYVFEEWTATGGKIYASEGGYALYRETDGEAFVKEFCAPRGTGKPLLAGLLERTAARRFRFLFPPQATIFGARPRPAGMLLPADGYGSAFEDVFRRQNCYMNLMLD